MKDQRPNIKGNILLRVRMLYLLFIMAGLVVLCRLVYVQWFSAETSVNAQRLKESGRIFSEIELPAHRGSILSRDHSPLAHSLFRYQPLFDFGSEGLDSLKTFREQADSLAELLSLYFRDRTAKEYFQFFEREHARRYRLLRPHRDTSLRSEGWFSQLIDRIMDRKYLIRTVYDTIRDHTPVAIFPRKVDYEEWTKLKKYPLLNWNMGMVYRLEESEQRIYPYGKLARRTIGSEEGKGPGIDGRWHKELKGRAGKARRQRIARGFYGRVAGSMEDPVDGLDIETTLDMDLQDVADRALTEQLIRQKALWGTAIVMDVQSGEILSLVNLDRNPKTETVSEKENHALGSNIEPGSTFKLATMLALLEDAHLSPEQQYDTEHGKKVKVGPTTAKDEHKETGIVDFQQAVALSSNVYFAKAVWEHYAEKQKRENFRQFLLKNLHFNRIAGLERLGARKPQIDSFEEVDDPTVMLVKMSYGYRIRTSPLQIATLYNAIANQGKMVAPLLVKRLWKEGEVLKEFKTEVIDEKICSKKNLHIIQRALEEVAVNGTARYYFGDTTFLKVAAKTGTAQVTDVIGQQRGDYFGSMVVYFPAQKPRYTVLVSVRTFRQDGQTYFGSGLAGPVVKEIVRYLHTQESQSEEVITQQTYTPPTLKGGEAWRMNEVGEEISLSEEVDEEKRWVTPSGEAVTSDLKEMPDVRGMGLREALFLLEQRGLKVSFKGEGAVREQSIAPKSRIHEGRSVHLILR